MADFTIDFISIKQMTFTSPSATCKVEINFHIGGPHNDIDLVQVYAIPAGLGNSAGLGNVVDSVDVDTTEFDYPSTPDLPAGTSMTIGLCPRSTTGGVLDDQIDDQYWESYCIFRPFTTTLDAGPDDPEVTVSAIEPATLNNPNQITIGWSGSNFTNGQVLWGPLNNAFEYTWSWTVTDQGNEPQYSGQQTFVIPSALQGKILAFRVEVVNTFQDTSLWFPTTIGVQSARNYHSARNFLEASKVSFPTGARHFGKHSLRALMQI